MQEIIIAKFIIKIITVYINVAFVNGLCLDGKCYGVINEIKLFLRTIVKTGNADIFKKI